MLVNLGGNRTYTFDLTRMKGGQAHEIYQRGSELENMDVQVEGAQLTDTGKANLQDYLSSINSTQGLSTDRNLLLNPKAGSGDNSFSFTWTGQQTISSIRTFMNGVSGSDLFLSKIPTARRIETKADEKKYLTPHLVRRHLVSDSNEITEYGAVHEIFSKDQQGKINNVEWVKPEDGDPMTNIAVVKTDNYVDIIYTSNDLKERSYDGITFAGKIAVARKDATTGKILFSYVYGSGKVLDKDLKLNGTETQELEITGTTTASTNLGIDPAERENTVTVNGQIENSSKLRGQWLQTKFGDGSGYGMKVKDLKKIGDSTVITVEQLTPFRLTGEVVETLFYPKISIPGKAYVVINESEFVTPPEIATHAPSMILQSEKAEISVNVKDNGGGIKNTTVTLDGKQAENPLVIEPISLSIGSHTIGVTVFDREGNQFSKEYTFTVTIDTDHLDDVIRAAGDKGLVPNIGVLQSLLSRAWNLEALQNEVGAQSGKYIDKGFAILLLKDIEYLKGHE
jgi:hypothetical protein